MLLKCLLLSHPPKISGPNGFTGKLFQTCKDEITLKTIPPENRRREILPNLFSKSSMLLIINPDKDVKGKKKKKRTLT